MDTLFCEDCGSVYYEDIEDAYDYGSVFDTGYCSDCLAERVERGEEW